MKLKLTLKIILDWLISCRFCHDIFRKRFLVRQLHISHVTKMVTSIVFYHQTFGSWDIRGDHVRKKALLTKSWVWHGYEMLNANKKYLMLLLYQFSRKNFPRQTSSVLNFLVLCFSGWKMCTWNSLTVGKQNQNK